MGTTAEKVCTSQLAGYSEAGNEPQRSFYKSVPSPLLQFGEISTLLSYRATGETLTPRSCVEVCS